MFRNTVRFIVALLLIAAALLYALWRKEQATSGQAITRINCVSNLKQLSLAFRTWALDHSGEYPFNVSTNAGGTRELCHIGNDGFASNPAPAFQALANTKDLTTPIILVCPKDTSRKPADTLRTLTTHNITYRLHAATNVSLINGRQVLLTCPIDGNMVRCDGSMIQKPSPAEPAPGPMEIPPPATPQSSPFLRLPNSLVH